MEGFGAKAAALADRILEDFDGATVVCFDPALLGGSEALVRRAMPGGGGSGGMWQPALGFAIVQTKFGGKVGGGGMPRSRCPAFLSMQLLPRSSSSSSSSKKSSGKAARPTEAASNPKPVGLTGSSRPGGGVSPVVTSVLGTDELPADVLRDVAVPPALAVPPMLLAPTFEPDPHTAVASL